MNRVSERSQQQGDTVFRRNQISSGDLARQTLGTSRQTSLPVVQHPVLRRGTGSIGLTITQPATGLHPFSPSTPRNQAADGRSDRSHLNIHPLPRARELHDRGRRRNERHLQSVPEDRTHHRRDSHVLPPIQAASQEIIEQMEPQSTVAETETEALSDEESEDEEGEEEVVNLVE